MHFLLFYDVKPEFYERRGEFRDEHLSLAWAAVERGELLLGGAFDNPVDRALLLFDVDDPALVETFALADPYVRSGLVERWYVRPWKTVVGQQASTPVHPSKTVTA
jgi:uncharacterized protein YciI